MTTTRLGAACAGILMVIGGAVQAAPISGQGTWETTLQGRDLDGNLATFEAYYDTVLDITWLANANAAYGSSYDMDDGITDGRMTWINANAWAASLNPYGSGITGWRLPVTNPVNGTSYIYSFAHNGSTDLGHNISAPGTIYAGNTGSEMAHFFFNTLGNKSHCDPVNSTIYNCVPQSGSGLTNTGPFPWIIPYEYWSATEYAPNTIGALYFYLAGGYQLPNNKVDSFYAWAVRSGDVSAVPMPATAWLFVSGLLGLVGVTRKRRR